MLLSSPLGQKTPYITTYSPQLLFPVPRSMGRERTGVVAPLPFHGVDIWNGFELSWLNPKGKPVIAMAEFHFPCDSINIVESKSLKLYLNSFNQSRFDSIEKVTTLLKADLEAIVKSPIVVRVYSPDVNSTKLANLNGECIDHLDIETDVYLPDAKLLRTTSHQVTETLYSDLLKSNCLATGQPDWGTIWIHYSGNQIDRASLLKYIISYRNHSGFAEHCVEQMFSELLKICQPSKLSVYLRYTKRGGLDINPFRSNFEQVPSNFRQARQ